MKNIYLLKGKTHAENTFSAVWEELVYFVLSKLCLLKEKFLIQIKSSQMNILAWILLKYHSQNCLGIGQNSNTNTNTRLPTQYQINICYSGWNK